MLSATRAEDAFNRIPRQVHVARLIGADADEIIFTSGATEANNLALLGLGKYEARGKRRRILVSDIEHKCVLEISRILHEQFGYQIELLPLSLHVGHKMKI